MFPNFVARGQLIVGVYKKNKQFNGEVMGSLLYLPVIWAIATSWLLLLTTVLIPESHVSKNLKDGLQFPGTLDELKSMATLLTDFQVHHPHYVFLLFVSAYLYKQTFAIPGSVFLNVLAGALYGPLKGTAICSILTAFGASMCYLLSKMTGVELVLRIWSEKISQLRNQVEINKNRLPYFLLSIRLVPITPNWFINMTSPLLGIPLEIFIVTAFIGLMPYNFICVQAGNVLAELHSLNDLLNLRTAANFLMLAIVASLPALLNKKLKEKA